MIVEGIIMVVYAGALVLILVYALAQFNLLLNYIQDHKSRASKPKLTWDKMKEVPFVTVQLPVYNELYVIERLLRNIVLLDYPKERIEFQVLDDSTDESKDVCEKVILELQAEGYPISHCTRETRVGFKAGALKEGLRMAKGEYIAIFDSDFLPQRDWLKETLPYFDQEKIGMVQTRWGHMNRNFSLLTKIQAFALDAHFTLEQVGRSSKGHFINFNGTAGIWRKECILDAGNWEGDTLTEDLDLSYRAQLKEWKFRYLENVVTPAELPMVMSAAKSQQFRWNKGGAENFKKMFSAVTKSGHMSIKSKLHGLLHLLNSTMFVNLFIVAVLSIPILYIKNNNPQFKSYFFAMSFLATSTVIFFVCYWVMFRKLMGTGVKNFIQFVGLFLSFFSIAMGFSLHNSLAVLEGHIGKKSAFVRTPKFNLTQKDGWKKNKYIIHKLSRTTILEGFLMLYFAFGMYSAFVVGNNVGDFGLFPFHLMLFMGFGFVFYKSIWSKA